MAPRLSFLVGLIALGTLLAGGCAKASRASGDHPYVKAAAVPSTFWNSTTVYFLLIDRFHNGDTSNDHAHNRARDGAVLRSLRVETSPGCSRKSKKDISTALV